MSLLPQFGEELLKKMLKIGENVNNVNQQKTLNNGEMLNMLIMLVVFGTFRDGIHKQNAPKRLT